MQPVRGHQNTPSPLDDVAAQIREGAARTNDSGFAERENRERSQQGNPVAGDQIRSKGAAARRKSQHGIRFSVPTGRRGKR